jgi:hypothetical protein
MAPSTEVIEITMDGSAGGMEITHPRDDQRSVVLIIMHGTAAKTGLHWHEQKTEYLQILQGRARVRIANDVAIFTPDDGIITIPRFVIHEYGRADKGSISSSDPDLRVKEWVDPPDGSKEIFFRNIMGVINDRQGGVFGSIKMLLAVFTVMKEHDNYPVFVNGPGWLRRNATYAVLNAVSFFGRCCGFKGTNERYAKAS